MHTVDIFSRVFTRSTFLPDGSLRTVMVKTLPATEIGLREIETMKILNNPNIIPLLGSRTLENGCHEIEMLCLDTNLLELVGAQSASVSEHGCALAPATGDRMSEMLARDYFRQMVSAVSYIHQQGFAHRDLKLENVVVSVSDRHLYLIDFEFSERLDSKSTAKAGSIHYFAPEIVDNETFDLAATDIWSLGICLYVMTTGYFPFNGRTVDDVIDDIQRGLIFPVGVSVMLRDLLEKMLNPDPKKRISIAEVEQHIWLRGSCPVAKGAKGMFRRFMRRFSK